MEKTFNIALDIAKPIDPANALNFFRGDSVVFNFTYQNNGEAFDTASATKLRVYAKAIGANGIVTAEETPLFSAEVTTINTVSFASSSTAGDAGNYLMAVILLDAKDNVITAQAIFLNLIENGYAGIYQPGVDYRDQILDALSQAQAAQAAAQQAAQQAQTSETNAAASVTQAQASVTQAQGFAQAAASSQTAAAQSESNAQASATAAAGSATQAQTSATNAQTAQTAAETAAQIAQATDAGKLALDKLSAGTLYFNNAKLFGSNFTIPNFPFSICATVRVDSWEGSTQGIQTIFQFGNNGTGALWGSICFNNVINNPTIQLRISKNTDGTLSYSEVFYFFDKDTFLGKEHTIIGVCRELESTPVNFDIYVDGAKVATSPYKGLTLDSLSGTVNYAVNTYNANYSVQPASAHPMMLRNLYVFNFDVSAPAAPYSIADYVAGRLIPPALKPSQVSLALENYTIARNATTKLVKDASGNSNDATVQGSGTVAGDNDQSIKVFVDEIKTQINQANG